MTAQLIDAVTGGHVWSARYDFNAESYAHAKTLLERALAIDPESCEANMVLSLINHHIASMGFAKDYEATAETPCALGRRAIQLDDRNEYAHWALGISCWGPQRYDDSLIALERALEINPNCSVATGSICHLSSHNRAPRRGNPATGNGHLRLIASHMAQGEDQAARHAVARCLDVLPETTPADLKRVPVQDAAKMDELRNRLQQVRSNGRNAQQKLRYLALPFPSQKRGC